MELEVFGGDQKLRTQQRTAGAGAAYAHVGGATADKESLRSSGAEQRQGDTGAMESTGPAAMEQRGRDRGGEEEEETTVPLILVVISLAGHFNPSRLNSMQGKRKMWDEFLGRYSCILHSCLP